MYVEELKVLLGQHQQRIEALQEETSRLTEENLRLKKSVNGGDIEEIQRLEEENAGLQGRVQELEEALTAANEGDYQGESHQAREEELKARVNELEYHSDSLARALEQLENINGNLVNRIEEMEFAQNQGQSHGVQSARADSQVGKPPKVGSKTDIKNMDSDYNEQTGKAILSISLTLLIILL